uniref:Uncharacterized protein n=1 Tax=Setaria viridis TaxID=4556 RepID=A0A4U6TNL7_SETVI|nr:uncharacterized protein LOC117863147 [Setaria viridis]TKW02845.1 hypothetical protein SEVIR_7G035458v2 [Setaria viridis]
MAVTSLRLSIAPDTVTSHILSSIRLLRINALVFAAAPCPTLPPAPCPPAAPHPRVVVFLQGEASLPSSTRHFAGQQVLADPQY